MTPNPQQLRLLGLLGVLSVAYAWFFNWSEAINNPNEMVRVQTVVALADHGTYALADREVDREGRVHDYGPVLDRFGVVHDEALACRDPGARPPTCSGKLYAAKAPGLALLGVPVYLAHKGAFALFGVAASRAALVWWLRLICVVLPTLALWLLLARHFSTTLERPALGLAVVLAAACGSLSLTYGQMFAGHQPAAVALGAAFLSIVHAGANGGRRWVALGGLFAGAAAAIEYPAAGAALTLSAWLVLRRRNLPDTIIWILAASVPMLLTAHFHWVAFGSPFRLPYAFLEDPGFLGAQSTGLFGIGLPSGESIVGTLFSPYTGLLFFAPWVSLAVLGVVAIRARRGEAAVALIICAYFLWVQCGYQVWRGGWVVGPRHLTAMIPFAAIATVHGLDAASARLRSVAAILMAIAGVASIAITGAASCVSQGFPEQFYNPLREAVSPLLQRGFIAANPLMALGVPGPYSGAPYFVALAIAAGWMVVLLVPSKRRVLVGCGIALAATAWVVAMWRVGPGPTPTSDKELRRLMRDWRPPRPPGSDGSY